MAPRQLTDVLRHLRTVATKEGDPGSRDRDLLERFVRQRDEAAFEALVARHGPMVLDVCTRVLCDPDTVEDAFQATFLVLVQKAGSIAKGEQLGNWLYGVAYRTAARARVEAAKRRAREKAAPARQPSDPLAEITVRELFAALDEELSGLPSQYRAPLVLCCLEGRTRDEAARQLAWSLSTLDRRLERGRALLRARLARRGLTLSGALFPVLLSPGPASAGVPASLSAATVKVAALSAGEKMAAGVISATVAELAEGVLRAMFVSKLRIATAVLLAVTVLGAAAGLFAHQLLAARAEDGKQPAVGRPASTGRTQPATDQHGDPLPEGALARLGTVRYRHGGGIFAVALAPDGKTLAAATSEWRTGLWDVVTGKQLRVFEGHGYWVLCVAFSPDGTQLATGSKDRTIRLWDKALGLELRRFHGHQGDVLAVAFSPDGKTLASAGSDRTIRLWETATGKQLQQLTGHQGEVRSLAFSPGGKSLGSGSADQTIRLWDVSTGRELRQIKGEQGEVFCVAFSPDGKTLASGGAGLDSGKEGTLRLWETATGKRLGPSPLHPRGVRAVAFSRDGKTLASAGLDRMIRLHEVTTGKEVRRLEGHHDGILSVVFSPDGKTLASGGQDSTIGLWDSSTGKDLRLVGGHHHGVRVVVFSPSGKTLATASRDRTIRLWEAATGKELRRLQGHRGEVDTLTVSPDGRLLASGGEDRTIRIWDLGTGRQLRTIDRAARVLSVAFSPDGRTLASGDEGKTVRLWKVASGEEVRSLDGHQSGVAAVVFSPDGKTLASGSSDSTARLWEVSTGKELGRFTADEGVCSLAFSPDGKLLATTGNGPTARLFEVATGKLVCRPQAHGMARSVAFSPDGRALAVGFWRMLSVVEVATGKERTQFWGHRGDTTSVAFSPTSKALASAGSDTTAIVWDLTGRARAGLRQAGDLTAKERESLWSDLAGADAARAYRAMCRLAAAPRQVLPLLKGQLKPAAPVDARRVAGLLADLDDDAFAVREKASEELEKYGARVESALKKALERPASAEVRQRVQRLLDALLKKALSADELRNLRALELLEMLDAPEARRLLETLAGGASGAWPTEQAKAALGRLAAAP